jgi:peptidoglycan/LPS O-acetylase OafA/YrhL
LNSVVTDRKLEAADGLRGLACAIVLLAHAVTMFYPSTGIYLGGSGKIGVWLFFVLSACLLSLSLRRSDGSFRSIVAYFVGRFIRIFPLFTIAVLTYYILGTAHIETPQDVISALSLTKGYAHLWTIPVEFTFYLVLPILLYLCVSIQKEFHFPGLLIFFALGVGLQELIYPHGSASINDVRLCFYFVTFGAGIICGIIISDYTFSVGAIQSALIATVVGIFVVFSLPGVRYLIFATPLDFRSANWFSLFGIGWAAFVLAIIKGEGAWRRFFLSGPLCHLGRWSFPVYLFHWLVYMTLIESYPGSTWAAILAIPLAVLLGYLVHRVVEVPLEAIRKNVHSKLIRLQPRPQEVANNQAK